MQYKDVKDVVAQLHTGGQMPDAINIICKLVLGKLSRLRLKSRVKIKELTLSGLTEFNLSTSIPDFFALKSNAENKNKCIYYYQSTEPDFLTLTNNSRFVENTDGGYCTMVGSTLKISFPTGISGISKIYIPYYSKYLVANSSGTEKETPDNDEDVFLFDSTFDDAFIEGILLYLKRRELDDNEFTKAMGQWQKALNDLVFYQ